MELASPLGSARPATVRFEPRVSGGRVRLLCRLDPNDDAGYASAVARVHGAVERSLGSEVLANRVAVARVDPGEIRLRGWRAERGAFRREFARAFRSGLVLRADVAACYPSLTPSAVRDALGACDVDPDAAEACVAFVERFVRAGVDGLPIGPAPSAVLANAALAVADEPLRRRGATFLRWVDDWWVGVRSEDEAAAVLRELARALSRRGLRLNEAKTRLGLASDLRPTLAEYHRAADAHAVPGVPGSNAVVPVDGGVAARR